MAIRLIIMKEVSPKSDKQFRLIEVYQSIDGPRSRLSHHCFSTYEDAVDAVMEFEFTRKPHGH